MSVSPITAATLAILGEFGDCIEPTLEMPNADPASGDLAALKVLSGYRVADYGAGLTLLLRYISCRVTPMPFWCHSFNLLRFSSSLRIPRVFRAVAGPDQTRISGSAVSKPSDSARPYVYRTLAACQQVAC